MKVIIYILCYDLASEEEAVKQFGSRPWARIYHLPQNPYLESAMFFSEMDKLKEDWIGSDYVGTLSWKALQKIEKKEVLQGDLSEWLGSRGITPNVVDLFAFHPLRIPLVVQTLAHHPRFLEIWEPILLSLGFNRREILSPQIPNFLANYWISTPEWMERYIKFSKQVKLAADSLAEVQEPLWCDSGYDQKFNDETCRRIWGRNYMPYHPFFFERIPCFFFWRYGARILLNL